MAFSKLCSVCIYVNVIVSVFVQCFFSFACLPYILGWKFLYTDLIIEYNISQDEDQESIIMPNKDGENFLCFLPKVEKVKSTKSITQHNTSSMIVETEKRVKLKTSDELLEELKDRCFLRVKICFPKRQKLYLDALHPSVIWCVV